MTKTYTIERFENLIEIGTTLYFNWFRGHSRIIGELTPSIFRPKFYNEFVQSFNPNPEFRIAEDFKRKAPSLSKKLPKPNNHIDWLFLMQHHGAPTRLLDWSENILIAAFFAVTNDYKEDAEIWTFLPWKLNESYKIWGLPVIEKNKIVKFLSNEIFHNNPAKLAEKYGFDEIPKVPFALEPRLSHPRITAQQSCFTIHPIPEKGFTIPDVIQDEKFLTRYIIPKNLKRDFEKKLNSLGVNYQRIYPDLEGLAKTIIQDENIVGWGQPQPPKFKENE